ncbi:MAG: cytochrome d ubiquinol oxidase subunit II [Hyphomicrobiaceae bacterium]
MMIDLAFVWAGLIAFAVLAYVILDGFDLGVGILFPLLEGDRQRDTAMNTVAPVWDGNETWLVLGGGGLFAVFPLAYAVVMPALYMPITLMLLGLIFRGVSFEYRWRATKRKAVWDWSFTLGSLFATFCQGLTLGALVQGIEVENRAYAGGWWDWLTPFSVLTGTALVIGYSLLGATWLVMKTEGALQRKALELAWIAAPATLLMIGIVSLWTPFLDPVFMERWFSYPAILYTAPVPLFVFIAGGSLFFGLSRRRDIQPFMSALALFVLCFVGLGIGFYPYIVPHSITIWDAAAPDSSLAFLLVGALILLPMILAYTAYSYWVFRGKVREGEGYH